MTGKIGPPSLKMLQVGKSFAAQTVASSYPSFDVQLMVQCILLCCSVAWPAGGFTFTFGSRKDPLGTSYLLKSAFDLSTRQRQQGVSRRQSICCHSCEYTVQLLTLMPGMRGSALAATLCESV